MGDRRPPPPVARIVWMNRKTMSKRLSIFPLTGAVLFPGMQLPLHLFEPRYRALVSDALIRDRQIAMIQPQRPEEGAPLYSVGCIGRIGEVQAMEDGRYNVILEGVARFRMLRELDVTTAFRQIEADIYDEDEDETLTHAQRGGFEREARRFADAQGYSVDWGSVERLDDRSLINGVSQIAPFDPASKQALLEAETLTDRCELLVQLMQFFGRTDGSEEITTLQ
jgi:uncharacterized protein